jgi:hypothetical protein
VADRPKDWCDQQDATLTDAREALFRALRCLDRQLASADARAELRERASTIEQAARAAYVAVREVEWNAGVPTEEVLREVVRLAAERREQAHVGPDPVDVSARTAALTPRRDDAE